MTISRSRHRNIMPSRWWNIVIIARKACGNFRLHTDFMILYVQHVEENNKNVSFFSTVHETQLFCVCFSALKTITPKSGSSIETQSYLKVFIC